MRFTASRGLSEVYRRAVEGHTPWSRDTRAPQPIVIQDVEADEGLRPLRDTILHDRARVVAAWYDAAQGGREFTAEYRFQTPDGRVPWVAGAAVPLKDVGGHVAQYLGTVTDITARKLSEEALVLSERRFRTLADAAPALIWYDDAEGDCQFVNRQYLDFFGKSLTEVQGRAWQPLLHPHDSSGYLAAWRHAIAERQPFTYRTRVRRHDGEWRWIESHALPLFGDGGEFLGHVGVSPDITDAVTAERRKDEFLATLAHELRNPLAAIRNGLIRLLAEARPGASNRQDTTD
jgi:PAS domain S-box-containing protein